MTRKNNFQKCFRQLSQNSKNGQLSRMLHSKLSKMPWTNAFIRIAGLSIKLLRNTTKKWPQVSVDGKKCSQRKTLKKTICLGLTLEPSLRCKKLKSASQNAKWARASSIEPQFWMKKVQALSSTNAFRKLDFRILRDLVLMIQILQGSRLTGCCIA